MKKNNTVLPKNVDEYLHTLSEPMRSALDKMRDVIKTTAPMAEEIMSYQIPTYKYKGALVHFAAFENHCSLYVVSKTIFKVFQKELHAYKTSGTTIHFTPDKPIPRALVQKIIKVRIKENEERKPAKKDLPKEKDDLQKLKDEKIVLAYLDKLEHPLKAEIEAVRKIIKNANRKIMERIKWNAPSYYYKEEDIVTFNHRATDHVHLVFHHPFIVEIKSDLLQGDYENRRMTYFKNMKEVKESKKELVRIINAVVTKIEKNK